ncbi:MAG: DUF4296 domain-containing protein [Bacteroidia bacterium]|nr:DUF4296 domain-containing protein [Bacteroidia bacterium]
MKYLVSYFSVVIFFMICSCGNKKEKTVEIPAGILNKDSFAVLLRDFALAESAASMNVNNIPLRDLDSVYAFNPLKQHGIRQSQYDSTIKFYVDNPKLYKEVYEAVLEQLSIMESNRTAVKKDSLQTIKETELREQLEKKALGKQLKNK